MNQQEAAARIAELLVLARCSIEEAQKLGVEHNVSVDLNQVGIGDEFWYVSEQEYRDQIIDNEGYDRDNLTEEEIADIDRQLNEVKNNGGYDGYGYKAMGWMSSSTNC